MVETPPDHLGVFVLSVACDLVPAEYPINMTFFVNGYELEQVTDYDFGAGTLGFLAEARDDSGVRVHFDNLRVWTTE